MKIDEKANFIKVQKRNLSLIYLSFCYSCCPIPLGKGRRGGQRQINPPNTALLPSHLSVFLLQQHIPNKQIFLPGVHCHLRGSEGLFLRVVLNRRCPDRFVAGVYFISFGSRLFPFPHSSFQEELHTGDTLVKGCKFYNSQHLQISNSGISGEARPGIWRCISPFAGPQFCQFAKRGSRVAK